MNTKDLRAFMRVYECKSINFAAKYLYMSPQGISKLIMRLENELNVALFIRTTSGVEPTSAATHLYLHSENIIRQLDSLYQEIHAQSRKPLNIPCTNGFMRLLTMQAINNFSQKFPDVDLHIYEQNDIAIDKQLTTGEAELAVLSAPIDFLKYDATFLAKAPICIVVHKNQPLARRKYVTPEDLVGLPIITSSSNELHAYQEQSYPSIKNKLKDNIVFEAVDIDLLLAMVNSNAGTALVAPLNGMEKKYSNIKIIHFQEENYYWETYLVYRKNRVLSGSALAFQDFLLEWISKHCV